jgi:hypothetical protein
MQYFRKPLALIFSLFFFLFSFLTLLPKSTYALIDVADVSKLGDFIKNFPKDNPWSIAKEFCDKRNGDLMNLETWYSGKCGKDINSKSGEGVGFVDIIILQGYEWLFHPQYKSLPEQMIDTLNMVIEIKDKMTYDNYKEKLQELAIKQSQNGDLLSKVELAAKGSINTKPASSIDYIAYISKNLKNNQIVDSAYAATPGYGFGGLAPILPVWRAFRNIANKLLAIAFVKDGIMIMFRIRVDAKATASIMIAIPKLITTLLIITFSYAIVGLLVDISTVATALAIDVLRVGKIINDPISKVIGLASGQSEWGAFGSFLVNMVSAIVVSPFIIFNLLLGGLLGVGVAWGAVLIGLATGFGELIAIILFVAIIWSYFKLIVALFKNYLSVIISLIFSPLILLGNVMPGSKAFSKWIMGIIGSLAAFPTAAFLLVLSYALMMQPLVNVFGDHFGVVSLASGGDASALGGNGGGTPLWGPPLVVPQTDRYGDLMLAAIGVGLLLMSSKYVDMVTKAFGVDPFPYGAAIGEALKAGRTGGEKFVNSSVVGASPAGPTMQRHMNTINNISNIP